MDYNVKSDLISQLANSFDSGINTDLHVDTSNFVKETVAMDCTAMALDVADLRKTKRVIDEQLKRFSASKHPEAPQFMAHLRIADKCISEIINLKTKRVR